MSTGTGTEWPRVTVVIVVTQVDVDDVELSGPAAEAIYSIQEQDYPEGLIDIDIIRDVGFFSLEELRVFGVDRAETDLVAFIREDEVWEPGVLRQRVEALQKSGLPMLPIQGDVIMVKQSLLP